MVSRGVREKRDKKDLQREKKSDSWRNTDTQKEKQRKLESGDGRHTQPLAKQHGAESHTLTDTPTDTQIDRQTDGRTDDQPTKLERERRMAKNQRTEANHKTDGCMEEMRNSHIRVRTQQ